MATDVDRSGCRRHPVSRGRRPGVALDRVEDARTGIAQGRDQECVEVRHRVSEPDADGLHGVEALPVDPLLHGLAPPDEGDPSHRRARQRREHGRELGPGVDGGRLADHDQHHGEDDDHRRGGDCIASRVGHDPFDVVQPVTQHRERGTGGEGDRGGAHQVSRDVAAPGVRHDERGDHTRCQRQCSRDQPQQLLPGLSLGTSPRSDQPDR